MINNQSAQRCLIFQTTECKTQPFRDLVTATSLPALISQGQVYATNSDWSIVLLCE